MKASSLPNLNRETTSYHNFFTLYQDPNHHDDTTLHKRPKIDHSQISEPSETSPFKDILSPLVSFNGSSENHYPVGGWDQNQMDQTLPRLPPSPTRSSDTNISVGSNPFSGNVGARLEGPNFTQLRWDQTPPNTSSVGSDQLSGNVGARSEGPNFTQLREDQTLPSMSSVRFPVPNTSICMDEVQQTRMHVKDYAKFLRGQMVLARSGRRLEEEFEISLNRNTTKTTADLPDDGYAWDFVAIYPRNYYRCTHRHDQGCRATPTRTHQCTKPHTIAITLVIHQLLI